MPTALVTIRWRIDCKSTLQNWKSGRKCWNSKIDHPKRDDTPRKWLRYPPRYDVNATGPSSGGVPEFLVTI
jgi:hypothetical protein